jgi:hypothetical protein
VGIFGRRKRKRAADDHEVERESYDAETEEGAEPEEPEDSDGPSEGPYDISEAPEDGIPRMDLGSIRVPVPNGSQVQVEMDQKTGTVRAVHVVTPQGQVTVSAYAAPKSGGLWREVSGELADQLRSDGARVTLARGEWGIELSAIVGEVALRFIGVDGPRWMLRGVIAGPQSEAARAPDVLRSIMRGTIVDRGRAPMPVRTPLQITLPEAIASHIKGRQAAAQQPRQTQPQR